MHLPSMSYRFQVLPIIVVVSPIIQPVTVIGEWLITNCLFGVNPSITYAWVKERKI